MRYICFFLLKKLQLSFSFLLVVVGSNQYFLIPWNLAEETEDEWVRFL